MKHLTFTARYLIDEPEQHITLLISFIRRHNCRLNDLDINDQCQVLEKDLGHQLALLVKEVFVERVERQWAEFDYAGELCEPPVVCDENESFRWR